MSDDPLRVPLSKVVDFLRDIGLDPVDVKVLRSVHFDPGVVTVVRKRQENGRDIVVAAADGDGYTVATETITIGVEVET